MEGCSLKSVSRCIVRTYNIIRFTQLTIFRPGSCINQVSNEASKMLKDALERVLSLIHIFLHSLLPVSANNRPFVFNMSSYEISVISDNEQRVCVKPFAFSFLDSLPEEVAPHRTARASIGEDGNYILENEFLRAIISLSGELISLRDKRIEPPREVVMEGMVANSLKLYDDVPFYWYTARYILRMITL